ncbi:hypothetical protein P1P91_12340 [Halomonas piscis]|uniref:Zinc resistance-associated protein n=1 Tax=Halomonas piscis TaxID=3031727 RepID=A0ABY9YYC3_9GAMM|nr:hypothetical protein [Halomonas piscis]WNK19617.1 hypothetical protein P1P91_12340 [Halomonas piscis]
MTSPLTLRQRLAPALLAAVLLPLAFSAQAAPGQGAQAGDMPDALKERMEERRQAVYDKAGIDQATREELNTAQKEHYQAMQELRQDYRQRMQEILTEEQQQSLNEAMREVQREQMQQRGQGQGEPMPQQ